MRALLRLCKWGVFPYYFTVGIILFFTRERSSELSVRDSLPFGDTIKLSNMLAALVLRRSLLIIYYIVIIILI